MPYWSKNLCVCHIRVDISAYATSGWKSGHMPYWGGNLGVCHIGVEICVYAILVWIYVCGHEGWTGGLRHNNGDVKQVVSLRTHKTKPRIYSYTNENLCNKLSPWLWNLAHIMYAIILPSPIHISRNAFVFSHAPESLV